MHNEGDQQHRRENVERIDIGARGHSDHYASSSGALQRRAQPMQHQAGAPSLVRASPLPQNPGESAPAFQFGAAYDSRRHVIVEDSQLDEQVSPTLSPAAASDGARLQNRSRPRVQFLDDSTGVDNLTRQFSQANASPQLSLTQRAPGAQSPLGRNKS